MRRDKRIELRVTQDEKDVLIRAAGGQRQLSEFLREAGIAAAREKERRDRGVRVSQAMSPVVHVGDLPPVSSLEVTCSAAHHHRKNVYCGRCGKVN